MDSWLPKSILCLRNYSSADFWRDLLAGVTVGLVALPLAMAFSIASGLSPQAGIYCAVVTGFLINPISFIYGIFDNFLLVASIIGALLVGKWMAAWGVGRAFGYNQNEQLTIWSLTPFWPPSRAGMQSTRRCPSRG